MKENPYRKIPVGDLYKALKQFDQNKKWRKKYKDPKQLTIDGAIKKVENDKRKLDK